MTGDSDLGADRLGESGDDIYAALMAAHDGLSLADSAALNACLVLLLANLSGDRKAILAAIETAAQAAAASR